MRIICLTPIEDGVYTAYGSNSITVPPDGWAYIPDDFQLPSTFPRLSSIEAENVAYTREVEREDGSKEKREYTMITVTSMAEGTIPEPVEPEPTQLDIIEAQVTYTAMMTDTLLEV